MFELHGTIQRLFEIVLKLNLENLKFLQQTFSPNYQGHTPTTVFYSDMRT